MHGDCQGQRPSRKTSPVPRRRAQEGDAGPVGGMADAAIRHVVVTGAGYRVALGPDAETGLSTRVPNHHRRGAEVQGP